MNEPLPSDENNCAENTDRELWREREGDFYADSIHVTAQGGIGINCGGYVYVKPLAEWHKLAGGKEAMQPKPDPVTSKTNPCGLAFQHWLDEPADAQTTVASAFQAGWDAALRHSSETRACLDCGKQMHPGTSCDLPECGNAERAALKANVVHMGANDQPHEGRRADCARCSQSEGEQHG